MQDDDNKPTLMELHKRNVNAHNYLASVAQRKGVRLEKVALRPEPVTLTLMPLKIPYKVMQRMTTKSAFLRSLLVDA